MASGAADPLAIDIELTDFASGDTRIASARLQSSGTRGAHTLRLAAQGRHLRRARGTARRLGQQCVDGTLDRWKTRAATP